MFKKGQVTNPLGAGAKQYNARRFAIKLLSPHKEKAIKAIVDALENGEPPIKLAAAKLVLEYVLGKPSQTIDMGGDSNIKININLIKNA